MDKFVPWNKQRSHPGYKFFVWSYPTNKHIQQTANEKFDYLGKQKFFCTVAMFTLSACDSGVIYLNTINIVHHIGQSTIWLMVQLMVARWIN